MVGGNNIDAFKRVGGPGASRKGKGKGSGKRATPRANLAGRSRVRAKRQAPRDRAEKESLLIHGLVRKRANLAPNGGRSEEELRPALGHDKSPRPGGNRHLEQDWRGQPWI